MNRNRLWMAALFLMLGMARGTAAAEPPRVTGIRHASQKGNTRVVVELSGPATWKQMALDGPKRVVLDVAAAVDPAVTATAVADGRLHRIRVGNQGSGVRIVFDVDAILDYRSFELPADAAQPPRVVFDFFGSDAGPAADRAEAAPPAVSETAGDGPRATATPAVVRAPSRTRPITVVVDAGHGGQDPGARGHGNDEKEICLAIARKVAAEIEKRPGFRARLTRDDDRFIPLRGRIEIAEKHDADAFISIHCNASKSGSASGTEVYFLSLSGATDEASRELARLENSADLMGGVAPEADDDLTSILFDMQQADNLQRASILAESVMGSLGRHPDLHTRGVKQAGFVVLKSPSFPSILVETAFITNSKESRLLASGTFQTAFARRVAEGVGRFFESTALAGLR
jgi:N-acetylmuramoyl-L-alanine amidase